MNTQVTADAVGAAHMPESPVNIVIEGKDFRWSGVTITTAEIIKLGGWESSQGVIEVDEHQNERTLAPDEVVHLEPGKEYGKRHHWKRGTR
jgi:hypothetical protein